jgi:hypothetical protein
MSRRRPMTSIVALGSIPPKNEKSQADVLSLSWAFRRSAHESISGNPLRGKPLEAKLHQASRVRLQ